MRISQQKLTWDPFQSSSEIFNIRTTKCFKKFYKSYIEKTIFLSFFVSFGVYRECFRDKSQQLSLHKDLLHSCYFFFFELYEPDNLRKLANCIQIVWESTKTWTFFWNFRSFWCQFKRCSQVKKFVLHKKPCQQKLFTTFWPSKSMN